MLKKLSAILILIAMTAALAGCGNDKDSSSKNESSATTEAITEEITEEETETLTEVPAESEPTAAESENSGSADTANTEEVFWENGNQNMFSILKATRLLWLNTANS